MNSIENNKLQPETGKVFQTFLLFSLPFLLLLAALLGFLTTQAINRDMVGLQTNSKFHLTTGANVIHRDIAAVVSDLTYLKNNPALLNYLLSNDTNSLAEAGRSLQTFSWSKKIYDQIRLLNNRGHEKIRVNLNNSASTLTAPERLQDKSKRYYFTDIMASQANELYISPLDLNIEHDQIEVPYKPMLRFAAAIVDQHGKKQGVIILNYLAQRLFDQYQEAAHSSMVAGSNHHFLGKTMLLNQDGYWLLSPNKKDEWGFMLGKQTTMATKFPEAWQQIKATNHGNIITTNGYFSFTTVSPLSAHHLTSNSASSSDYEWKLVKHIQAQKLRAINALASRFPWLLFAIMVTLAMPLFWLLAWSRTRHHLIEKDLIHKEEQYRLLYQRAPMPYQAVDEEAHILDVNQEWLRTLGYRADEVLDRPFEEFIVPEQREEFRSRFAEFKGRGQINNRLLKLLHRDGHIVLASFSGLIIRDDEGDFLRSQTIFLDITSQHKASDELAKNLALLESIINTIPSIICLKDDKGRWLLANHRYLDICGLAGVTYQGKTDDELAWQSARLHEELLSSKREDIRAWEKGKPLRSEKTITLPGNKGEVVFDIIRQPGFKAGKPQNLLMVGFDITDRKKNENTVRLNQLRFQALCKLHRMEDQSITDLHTYALETAGLLSASKLGYLHFFGGPKDQTSFTTWSTAGPLSCQAPEHSGHNPDAQAIWQECLSNREAVIHNNYPNLPQRLGVPLGHLPIIHHMAIPLVDGETIIGVLGLANKETPYSSEDAEQISLFASNIMAVFKQRQTALALKQSQKEWQRTFDAISGVVTIQDEAMHITQVNMPGSVILEAHRSEILGKKCYEIFHGSTTPCPGCPIQDGLSAFTPYSAEVNHPKLGKTFLVTASPIRNDQGDVTGIAHFAKDITAIKELEDQLRQSQKMEAVGTLAGGVAHDFNNILTTVSGYLELAMLKIPAEDQAFADLREVKKGANRAAELVRQLLLYSRKKPLQKAAINLNEIIQSSLKMLDRLIGEDITMITDLSPDLWQVMGDEGNIEQVLMNLTINAQDAMPEGGKLIIRTANTVLSRQEIPPDSAILPGKYILFAVEDNGQGMNAETRDHVFEPFFTTKETGKGTGMGLAVAYGIIKEHTGWIEVKSSPGQGSVFRIYLPAISPDSTPAASKNKSINPDLLKGNGERILLVEDEVMLNEFACKVLRRYNYQVSTCYDAEEALTLWDREGGDFDLVFSDMVLPGKTGLQLVEELCSRKPQLKRLLASGYTDKKSQAPLIKGKGIPFLAKPFNVQDMLKKIKEALATS